MADRSLPPALLSDMRLTGLFWILFGALSCLSIIGAIAGVPMLLSGLRAREAADAYERAALGADPYALETAEAQLAETFRWQKIYFIATLVFMAVMMAVYALVFVALLRGDFGSINGVAV